MRRTWCAVVGLSVLSLTACGGDGPSLPSSLPTELPSVTRTELPSRSVTPEPSESVTPEPSDSVTRTEPTATNSPDPTATGTETVTQSPEPTESASATPTKTKKDKAANSETDSGAPAWVWWVLGILLVAGLVTWWVVGSRRRKVVADWEARYAPQAETARWVDSRFVADLVSQPTAAQQEQVWTTGRPRLVEADAALDALANSAPDPEHRTQASQMRDALAGLRGAIDADVALASPGSDPEAVRASRAAVEQARSKLHDLLTPPAPQGG